MNFVSTINAFLNHECRREYYYNIQGIQNLLVHVVIDVILNVKVTVY